MENLYKKTNFGNHPPLQISAEDVERFNRYSDSVYDRHRFISHGFVPTCFPDGVVRKRLVSDVELCASSSPDVLSCISSEYQERLRNSLLSQQRPPSRDGRVTDDELMDSVNIASLEHDEALEYVKAVIGSSAPPSEPSSVEPPVEPPAEPSSVE